MNRILLAALIASCHTALKPAHAVTNLSIGLTRFNHTVPLCISPEGRKAVPTEVTVFIEMRPLGHAGKKGTASPMATFRIEVRTKETGETVHTDEISLDIDVVRSNLKLFMHSPSASDLCGIMRRKNESAARSKKEDEGADDVAFLIESCMLELLANALIVNIFRNSAMYEKLHTDNPLILGALLVIANNKSLLPAKVAA